MSKLFLFPIAVSCVCQLTFVSTSIMAVWLGHARTPYISDGATRSPESCVFGLLINIGCVLLGIVIYIRYRQIQQLMYHHNDLIYSTANMNTMAMWFGYVSCFGLSIVANFQLTNVPHIHYFGAFSCFGFGTCFFWLQAHLTYNIHKYFGSATMAYFRLVLAALCTYLFFVTIFMNCNTMSVLFDESSSTTCSHHLISVSAEWLVATLFCIYILTFTNEFRKISVDQPVISINTKISFQLDNSTASVSTV